MGKMLTKSEFSIGNDTFGLNVHMRRSDHGTAGHPWARAWRAWERPLKE